MFKKIKIILIIILVIVSIGTLSGCKFANYYPEYESGFYRYAVKTKNDGTKWAYLIGLTELGAEQTELIYPEKIDGIPFDGIGYNAAIVMTGTKIVGHLKSERLKKLFFPTTMKADRINAGPNIIEFNDNARVVYWSLDLRPLARLNNMASAIFGYNYVEAGKSMQKEDAYIGNVSYLYNYDNALNKGYYWVDSYDESVITFIPPIPNREGYQFGGWYKESDCTTEWNFETDVTDKEIVITRNTWNDNYTFLGKDEGIYKGIYLYAKWIKA